MIEDKIGCQGFEPCLILSWDPSSRWKLGVGRGLVKASGSLDHALEAIPYPGPLFLLAGHGDMVSVYDMLLLP